MNAGALAVLVKTPELSPVKTRLAADMGTDFALRAYQGMLHAMAATMRAVAAAGVSVYWAVGEEEGLASARWREFAALHTGDGDLGERLARVYAVLQKKHGRVALIGSDCPQLPAASILWALRHAHGQTVIGPAEDGGFYLFAAARRIPAKWWMRVEYSRTDTLTNLLHSLAPRKVANLPLLADVDDMASFRLAAADLQNSDLSAHRQLGREWAAILAKQ